MRTDPEGAPIDKSLVSLVEPQEVSYWTRFWGTTKDELRRAIREVGSSVDQLRAYFLSTRMQLTQSSPRAPWERASRGGVVARRIDQALPRPGSTMRSLPSRTSFSS
jgi:hypothetical protein